MFGLKTIKYVAIFALAIVAAFIILTFLLKDKSPYYIDEQGNKIIIKQPENATNEQLARLNETDFFKSVKKEDISLDKLEKFFSQFPPSNKSDAFKYFVEKKFDSNVSVVQGDRYEDGILKMPDGSYVNLASGRKIELKRSENGEINTFTDDLGNQCYSCKVFKYPSSENISSDFAEIFKRADGISLSKTNNVSSADQKLSFEAAIVLDGANIDGNIVERSEITINNKLATSGKINGNDNTTLSIGEGNLKINFAKDQTTNSRYTIFERKDDSYEFKTKGFELVKQGTNEVISSPDEITYKSDFNQTEEKQSLIDKYLK